MKKAKIALTAIAVLAVVGGALAFKARQNNLFYTTDPANGQCTLSTNRFLTTTEFDDPIAFLTTLGTVPTTDPCSQIVVKTAF